MFAPLAGSKKLLAAILPVVASRLPCTSVMSTLLKAALFHVDDCCHELPVCFCALLRLTCAEFVVLLILLAAMLLVNVVTAVVLLKPLLMVSDAISQNPECP